MARPCPVHVRNVCVTLFDFDIDFPEQIEEFYHTKPVSYLVYQLEECPSTGNAHVQGYIEFKQSVRSKMLKDYFPGIHIEERRGTAHEARTYCQKVETRVEGTTFTEFGTFNPRRVGQGSNLSETVAVLKARGLKGVALEMPGTFLRYHNGLEKMLVHLQEEFDDSAFKPLPWQQEAIKIIQDHRVINDDRSIHWFYDPVGAAGKSRLTSYICFNLEGIMLEGQVKDMCHAWDENKHKVACFDIARSQSNNMEHLATMAEKLKGGRLFSVKYGSKMKVFTPPVVFFFANVMPETTWWSEDRLHIHDLSQEPRAKAAAAAAAAAAASGPSNLLVVHPHNQPGESSTTPDFPGAYC